VSYEDANDFCRRLTEQETKAGRLAAGMRYQLPTEAQWEYACRAGTTTLWALGDQLSSNDANFDGTVPQTGAAPGPYLHETTPVGHYRANPWVMHDMHGNVWELCSDGYQAKLAGGEDPVGPASAKLYVMRGGCWHNNDFTCLPASRGFSPPDGRGSGLGFRVCLVQSKSL
jgi:formylglycine-generating enzyme required for sulfatase activity